MSGRDTRPKRSAQSRGTCSASRVAPKRTMRQCRCLLRPSRRWLGFRLPPLTDSVATPPAQTEELLLTIVNLGGTGAPTAGTIRLPRRRPDRSRVGGAGAPEEEDVPGAACPLGRLSAALALPAASGWKMGARADSGMTARGVLWWWCSRWCVGVVCMCVCRGCCCCWVSDGPAGVCSTAPSSRPFLVDAILLVVASCPS